MSANKRKERMVWEQDIDMNVINVDIHLVRWLTEKGLSVGDIWPVE